jgi:FkbM family methyltransferase
MLNIEILKLKFNLKVKNIAHIGAHNGKEVKVYKKLFPTSKIHLFEPNKLSFQILLNNLKNESNVQLHNIALGNKNEKKMLNISTEFPNTSSLLTPKLHKDYYPEVIFDNKEIVKLKRFDSLNLKNINFMSIDTQGFELEVLKGAAKNLEFIDYLIVEINRKPLYDDSPLEKDIDKFLKSHNFVRVVTSYWGKECVWGDGFYIRKEKISKILLLKSYFKIILYKNIFIYKFIRYIRFKMKTIKRK